MRFISYRPQPNLWSSLDRLASLHGLRDSAFDPKGLPVLGRGGRGCPAPLDIYENPDALTVRVEVPGFAKEDFEISLQDDNLTISGERRPDGDGSRRSAGRFSRTVTLPRAVSNDAVTARYENGVLTITLPTAEEAKPRKIEVNVN
jgi:HSP20 family protein